MTSPRWLACVLLATAPAYADAPVAKQATDHRTGTFTVGAGYNPDDHLVATAEIAQADLFRTGQRLALSGDVSLVRQRFRALHELPDVLGTGITLRTELFNERVRYPGFERSAAGGALTLERRLGPATRVYARYRLERVDLDLHPSETYAAAHARTAQPVALGEGLYGTLGAGLEYSTLDAPVPRSGTRLHLWVEHADRQLGSDYQLDRMGAELDHARALGPFTLRLHGRATSVTSRDPLGVPLAARLFHDGHRDVRGYALDTGGLPGANLEARGTVELELPVVKKWGLSVAGWADAGLQHGDELAGGALVRRSVGLSIIWRSPIGPLRFDWAFPLDGKERGAQFLFGLGGTF